MLSTIVRAVAATTTGLTTRDRVKSDLKITGTAEDAYIDEAIARVSALICSYLKVPMADDGSRTLASEDLVQTFRFRHHDHHRESLVLARKPVTAVAYVKINDVVIDQDDYELIGRSGILYRLRFGHPSHWPCRGKVEVRSTAGWLLPNDTGQSTLPSDIEGVAVDLIKAAREARTRDPMVKSVAVVDVDQVDYWVGNIGQGPFPPDIEAKLEAYRYRSL
ncbi:hypothetical protein HAP47_0022695 [Bradyrhizobium sp. 41S5]|uniref:hypothetical protein n=1 Tax=Bradyrhizobium sp. 41S5 TaxID=1404443 RepID=UPI00156A7F26|nr:hypothetical protein [Bradyrhizobium sp. 41S5]UFX42072.1 hypothetical protein HAP47_0022695 [Bradyrhizobium sp. 41S5]